MKKEFETLIERHFSFKLETGYTDNPREAENIQSTSCVRRFSRETRHLVHARENRTRLQREAGENGALCKSDFLSLNFVRNGLPLLFLTTYLLNTLPSRSRAVPLRSHRTLFSFLSHLVRCTSRRKKVHKGSRSAARTLKKERRGRLQRAR